MLTGGRGAGCTHDEGGAGCIQEGGVQGAHRRDGCKQKEGVEDVFPRSDAR